MSVWGLIASRVKHAEPCNFPCCGSTGLPRGCKSPSTRIVAVRHPRRCFNHGPSEPPKRLKSPVIISATGPSRTRNSHLPQVIAPAFVFYEVIWWKITALTAVQEDPARSASTKSPSRHYLILCNDAMARVPGSGGETAVRGQPRMGNEGRGW